MDSTEPPSEGEVRGCPTPKPSASSQPGKADEVIHVSCVPECGWPHFPSGSLSPCGRGLGRGGWAQPTAWSEGSSWLVRPLSLPSPARGEGELTDCFPWSYGSFNGIAFNRRRGPGADSAAGLSYSAFHPCHFGSAKVSAGTLSRTLNSVTSPSRKPSPSRLIVTFVAFLIPPKSL